MFLVVFGMWLFLECLEILFLECRNFVGHFALFCSGVFIPNLRQYSENIYCDTISPYIRHFFILLIQILRLPPWRPFYCNMQNIRA